MSSGRLGRILLALLLAGCAGKQLTDPQREAYVRGFQAYDSGDYARAVEVFEAEVRARPLSYLAHYMLGLSLRELEREGEAAAALETSLGLTETEGQRLRSLYALATVHLRRERYLEAHRVAMELMASDPDDPDYLRLECMALLGLGRTAAAGTCLRRLLELEPTRLLPASCDPDARAEQGERRRRLRQAVRDLERAHGRYVSVPWRGSLPRFSPTPGLP